MDSGSKIYVLSLSVETQMAFGLRVFDGFRHAVFDEEEDLRNVIHQEFY